jgi:hypothetical protein
MSWSAACSARRIARPANAYALASLGATLLFLFVGTGAVSIYKLDPPLYFRLLREDGQVERLTAILLCLAALFALIALFSLPRALHWARPFLVLFSIFSMLMALEEISWGQRSLKIEPGPFWQEYSDQKEINVHNVVQHYLRSHGYAITTTRRIAALVLLVFGVVFPVLNAFKAPRAFFRTCGLVVPPPALTTGFLFGALLAWFDWPTGQEEEIGEFLFSLCFALLVPLWLLQQRYESEPAATSGSRSEISLPGSPTAPS